MRKIIVGWTGASGIAYGDTIVSALIKADCEVHLVYSPAAELVYRDEMKISADQDLVCYLKDKYANQAVTIYDNSNLASPIASGSFSVSAMVIIPCSMSTLSALAVGSANSLLKRAADVMLKERRPLLIVPRETPLSLIHLRNMVTLTEAGAIVVPAMPAFYHHPEQINDLVDFVVGKVLDLLGIEHNLFQRYEPISPNREHNHK